MVFVGENLQAKVAQKKLFKKVWGNSDKSFACQNLPAPTPIMKRHLCSRCPSFERAVWKMPSSCLHSPAFLCILFYVHSLLVVVGYSVSLQ